MRVFCRRLLQWAPKCSVRSRVTPRSFRRVPADRTSAATLTVQLVASFGAWDRTRTWVFSLVTIIFEVLARRTRAAAACRARLFTISMVLPAHRDAMSSGYIYGVVYDCTCTGSAPGCLPAAPTITETESAPGCFPVATRPEDLVTTLAAVELCVGPAVSEKAPDPGDQAEWDALLQQSDAKARSIPLTST